MPTADAPQTAIERFLSPEACARIRATVAEYDGAEIFFVGRVGPSGLVEDAEAHAFGNRNAVPVIERLARPGDVVIHNHPSGDLEPSQPDVEIASRLGNAGVGSYVVDNEATRLRRIVDPAKTQERRPLKLDVLEKIIGPEGPVAKGMSRYEDRPEQAEMLREVAGAFNDDGLAVVEAGTGVGKSLAYLLPAVYWAKANAEKIVVSTNTINLQEQLIQKDIPFLRGRLGVEFEAELMKGRGNYLCKRRARYLRTTPDLFEDERTSSQIQAILDWAEKSTTGSLSELSFIPDSEVWERVACDADNCTRIKCRDYNACFFFMARRRAARADVVVTNHHLVMADLALRLETDNYSSTAVLPPYQRIVFDEAHNLEEIATEYFGIRLTQRALTRVMTRLTTADRSNAGLLPYLRDRLTQVAYEAASEPAREAAARIEEKLIPLRRAVADRMATLLQVCAEGVPEALHETLRPRSELRLRITPPVEETPFWNESLREAVDGLATPLEALAAGLRRVVQTVKELPEQFLEEFDNPIGELRSIGSKLAGRANEFRNFYSVAEDRCRWISVAAGATTRSPRTALVSLPLDVRDDLRRAVFSRKRTTVVMTSATLSVDKRFDFFLNQIGLGAEECDPDTRERVQTRLLETPFDYRRQAFLGVPIDLPEPREAGFGRAAVEFLLPALQISKGSAFLLFTSYRQLREFHDLLAPLLRPLGYSCLRQGEENRAALLERFRNDRTSILFATSSFWQGVDVPGDALRLLVLAKLPFRVPTDPLMQARIERLQAMGVDPFSEYSVPQAVIRFKQGFGRLIRTRDDYGGVLVLDRRIATKNYGRVFLNSLPVEAPMIAPGADVLEALGDFFDRAQKRG